MNQQGYGLNTNALLISSLLAGIGIGLLSHIPVFSCVNCLLFAWVWGGGIFAVFLYRRNARAPYVNTTQGVVIGALAGVVGAIIGVLTSLLFQGATSALTGQLNQYLGNQDGTGSLLAGVVLGAGFSFIRLVLDIVIYAVFGAIGGLLATALIWKAPANPPVTPAPPTYNPPPSGPVQ